MWTSCCPSRLSTCPRSHQAESRSVLLTVIRRGWNSWWKSRRSCLPTFLLYGVPPLVLQGGHRERRPTGTEDWQQHWGGSLLSVSSSRRTMAGPQVGSGPRHCLSLGRSGAHHRRLALHADPRCACAADGRPAGGIHAGARHCDPCAGCRSAQDFSGPNPAAFCGLASSAEGGAVGGSADCVFFLSPAAVCRADR